MRDVPVETKPSYALIPTNRAIQARPGGLFNPGFGLIEGPNFPKRERSPLQPLVCLCCPLPGPGCAPGAHPLMSKVSSRMALDPTQPVKSPKTARAGGGEVSFGQEKLMRVHGWCTFGSEFGRGSLAHAPFQSRRRALLDLDSRGRLSLRGPGKGSVCKTPTLSQNSATRVGRPLR